MSTKAVTHILDADDNIIVVIYTQWDGYYSGYGAELASILEEIKLVHCVNELGLQNVANGIHCLAATIIKKLKVDAGNIYLFSALDYPESDFIYTVKIVEENGTEKIKLVSGRRNSNGWTKNKSKSTEEESIL